MGTPRSVKDTLIVYDDEFWDESDQEKAKAMCSYMVDELAFLDWLIDINYPFDVSFDPAPPVDLKRLALRWKEREGWTDVSDEDAIACIEEEANCG